MEGDAEVYPRPDDQPSGFGVPFPGRCWRARTRQRLGELYESKGDLKKAGEHYARFIELWEKADPELQPAVKDARARLAAIKEKTG